MLVSRALLAPSVQALFFSSSFRSEGDSFFGVFGIVVVVVGDGAIPVA